MRLTVGRPMTWLGKVTVSTMVIVLGSTLTIFESDESGHFSKTSGPCFVQPA